VLFIEETVGGGGGGGGREEERRVAPVADEKEFPYGSRCWRSARIVQKEKTLLCHIKKDTFSD